VQGKIKQQELLLFLLKKFLAAVKGAANAVKSVAKSKIGRIALTIAAAYALGPAGLNIGAGMSPFAAGALKSRNS
jgi:hypothetical protein